MKRIAARLMAAILTLAMCPAMAKSKGKAKSSGTYYEKVPRLFTPAPDGKTEWRIKNFGPVGIGITLGKGMTMTINNVEKGSPADRTGKLKTGQIIESINGITLKERDPRIILGEIITAAEAKDGKVALKIQGMGTVVVKIPVLGSYSPTWPLNCKKSDKIVRNLADLLAKKDKPEWGKVIFMLSTGEENDLQVVRGWMKNLKSFGSNRWDIGYRGPGICEYYLRTGDASVLPVIKKAADHLRDNLYNGGWSGRGAPMKYNNGGHMNAAGVHCLTFLLLAKACGVEVDEFTLRDSLRHFYRYSGRGSVPYGDYTPKTGFKDCNGKTGGLAIAMATARRFTPNGDSSLYAKAMQVNAMKGYYGIGDYSVGHTGGGIGEVWKSAAMGLMKDSRPRQYRDYLDSRRWVMELSRRHTGAIGIAGAEGVGNAGYDKASGESSRPLGNFYALTYTIPRKHLQLFGAKRSKYAKVFELPIRPWGVAADDDFNSLLPVPGGPLGADDLLKEKITQDSGHIVEDYLANSGVSNKLILQYLHHPEITYRHYAIKAAVREKKDDILLSMLRSKDARQRHVAVIGLHDLKGTWNKKLAAPERITPAMLQEVERMVANPHESWYVKQWAVGCLSAGGTERILKHRNVLLKMLKHEEHWLKGSAISTLSLIASREDSYKEVIPPILKAIDTGKNYPIVTRGRAISRTLTGASPTIQAYALDLLKPLYLKQDTPVMSQSGRMVIPGAEPIKKASIGSAIGSIKGGEEFLLGQPKKTSAWKISKNDKDLFFFDGKLQTNERLLGTWTLVSQTPYDSPKASIPALTARVKKNSITSTGRIKYGFKFLPEGQVKVMALAKMKYTKRLTYSGNMMFSAFGDEAMHVEPLKIGNTEFLLVEGAFKVGNEEEASDAPQANKSLDEKPWKTSYKAYVKYSEDSHGAKKAKKSKKNSRKSKEKAK